MKRSYFFLFITALSALCLLYSCTESSKNDRNTVNIAVMADATSLSRGGAGIVSSLNDGQIPDSISAELRRQLNNLNRPGRPRRLIVQRYEYTWVDPVTINSSSVFLYDYDGAVRLPRAYRFLYWDGLDYKPVENTEGMGLINDSYNSTTFSELTTTKLMLEIDSVDRSLPVVLEWQVFKSPGSPEIAPVVFAGPDRSVITGGETYLSASIRSLHPLKKVRWSAEGPGPVTFTDPETLVTSAAFDTPGDYVLTLSCQAGKLKSSSSLKVSVFLPPPDKRLDVVYTKRFKIDNPLWNDRAKVLITNWIPHCIKQIERTDLTIGQGGLDNFIEAAKALRGEKHGRHLGFVFSNAWVHQTVESMCLALMVDPQGDSEIIAAQEKMKKTLEKWIPIILAAQEPDGYLQTAFTLRDTIRWKERWAPETRENHEGYVAGYFIESAINHYTLTDGRDRRLYDAAKKLADCWVANIGPGKKEWYDGHQEMEQALIRFGRFVNDMEGNGKGDSYIALGKYLLDCRKGGSEYDQSHVPVQQQYEAVGHAVRASYSYSAMADVAAETHDHDYESAVMSLWDNIVNKKYYVTGGIGSGETSEGFGGNYSLGNDAYCESCSSCGLIFFQYKMNLAYHDAKYADLYEETMYNALLGSIDFEGKNFFYTNPLASSDMRNPWHQCPCCVGNIPRTLLMIPTWTYVKSDEGIYTNLYIGSTVNIENVAGTDVEIIQKTDYPWKGDVSITVNPEEPKRFTLYIRVPDRQTSKLYSTVPEIKSLEDLTVNSESFQGEPVNGYIPITRNWKAGDRISFRIPLAVQTITADERIKADIGKMALRYGPLIYNVESADKQDINKSAGNSPLSAEWRDDMFNGIIAIRGKWNDGSDLIAIPNYLRLNRDERPLSQYRGFDNTQAKVPTSIVWIKK
jgi:DUF1680 family protein